MLAAGCALPRKAGPGRRGSGSLRDRETKPGSSCSSKPELLLPGSHREATPSPGRAQTDEAGLVFSALSIS